MSALNLDDLDNNNLNKKLLTQINIDDWPDEYGKCGQPKLLHRELQWGSSCNEPQETPEVLCRIWTEYKKRINALLAKI